MKKQSNTPASPQPRGAGPASDRSVPDAGPGRGGVDAFLAQAKSAAASAVAVRDPGAGRLVFALDATMSRQPTWDVAAAVQAQMFAAAADAAPLVVQLVYYRGFGECRASRWVGDSRALTGLMTGISCRGGQTQIERVLRHAAAQAPAHNVRALVFVGDAMEEPVDRLCAAAGALGIVGVKAFMFQEGRDPQAEAAFREIARLTGGAYARFDSRAPQSLAVLLKGAAAYASGGLPALERLGRSGSSTDSSAGASAEASPVRGLIEQIGGRL